MTDLNRRPLPFVTVKSWWTTGDISRREDWLPGPQTTTDLSGAFVLSWRGERPRLLTFGSHGYGVATEEIPPDSGLQVRLGPLGVGGQDTESLGLMVVESVTLRTAAGNPVWPPGRLEAGGVYEVVVTGEGGACKTLGPIMWDRSPVEVTVVVSERFSASGLCEPLFVQLAAVIEMGTVSRGLRRLRVIGRWRDIVIPIVVRTQANHR